MKKQELYEKDYHEIHDMDREELMQYSKEDIVRALEQANMELFALSCKVANSDMDIAV